MSSSRTLSILLVSVLALGTLLFVGRLALDSRSPAQPALPAAREDAAPTPGPRELVSSGAPVESAPPGGERQALERPVEPKVSAAGAQHLGRGEREEPHPAIGVERRNLLSRTVEELRRLAQDTEAAESDRVVALQGLAGRKDELGFDGRTEQVVRAVLEMAAGSRDPWVRSQVYRGLRGLRHDWLVDELAGPLTQDPDERVRVATLDVLAAWMPDGRVESTLRDSLSVETSLTIQRRLRAILDAGDNEEE